MQNPYLTNLYATAFAQDRAAGRADDCFIRIGRPVGFAVVPLAGVVAPVVLFREPWKQTLPQVSGPARGKGTFVMHERALSCPSSPIEGFVAAGAGAVGAGVVGAGIAEAGLGDIGTPTPAPGTAGVDSTAEASGGGEAEWTEFVPDDTRQPWGA